MAEIKVEKKRKNWLWIPVLLVVAVILYVLFYTGNGDSTDSGNITTVEPAGQEAAGGPVNSYISFIRSDSGRMDLDHEYSSRALSGLISATKAKADERGVDIRADLAHAGDLAEKIQNDPMATTHANSIREAAEIISTALQKIQQAHYTSLGAQAGDLRDAAMAIDPGKLTLDQKQQVKNFFTKAAGLLATMN